MGNEELLSLFELFGVDGWNRWREKNPGKIPDLRKADLSGKNLCKADLHEAIFLGANLVYSKLSYSNLCDANLSSASLNKSNLEETNLQNATLIETNLEEADISKANLRRANLREASLMDAVLKESDLRGADFESANLIRVDFQGADLRGANFKNADLRGANLREADIRGANFQSAMISKNDVEFIQQQADLLSDLDQIDQGIVKIELLRAIRTLKLVKIPAGSFQMGDSYSGRKKYFYFENEFPAHTVTISNDYYIGETVITQGIWSWVMGVFSSFMKYQVKNLHFGDDFPAFSSWYEAQVFLQRLNREFKSCLRFRLPSEAEWEYACRAASTTDYCFGNDASLLNRYAWVKLSEEEQYAHQVGRKAPNAWGLYDMHGNVYEWCDDNFHKNHLSAPKDGSSWVIGGDGNRVVKGATISDPEDSCRSACRQPRSPNDYCGFRVACAAPKSLG